MFAKNKLFFTDSMVRIEKSAQSSSNELKIWSNRLTL